MSPTDDRYVVVVAYSKYSDPDRSAWVRMPRTSQSTLDLSALNQAHLVPRAVFRPDKKLQLFFIAGMTRVSSLFFVFVLLSLFLSLDPRAGGLTWRVRFWLEFEFGLN